MASATLTACGQCNIDDSFCLANIISLASAFWRSVAPSPCATLSWKMLDQFVMVSRYKNMVIFHGFPRVFHGFPMIFLWCSYGFLWLFHGFPMFLGFPYGSQIVSTESYHVQGSVFLSVPATSLETCAVPGDMPPRGNPGATEIFSLNQEIITS